jgi:hypothetical protein
MSLVRLRFIPVFGAVSGWTTTEIGSVGKIEKVGLAERLAVVIPHRKWCGCT